MNFSRDLFISYTHADNQKLEGQPLGWVSRFHNTLEVQLRMRLGKTVEIWRDDKLSGNDNLTEEILSQLADVGLMLSILSPPYLDSYWCKREADAFCTMAASTVGLEVHRKFRIFKIYKLPVDSLKGLPLEFGQALGFPFYTSKDGIFLELDPAYGQQMVGDFNEAVARLAQKLAETINLVRAADPTALQAQHKRTIYLAETSWEMEPERKKLDSELTGRGYNIVPQISLPSREKEYLEESNGFLNQCSLAIHIVGSRPGMVPNGPSQKSVEALQNEIAAAQSRNRKLLRIIWLAPGTRSTNEEHQKFIDYINSNEEAQLGADLVTGDFEALKGAVLSALQKIERQDAAQIAAAGESSSGNLLYVVCDKRDTEAIRPLRQLFKDRGFDAKRPLFEGAASAIRQQNEKLLGSCHAVLVYYGAGDEEWYASTTAELEKVNRRVPVWTYIADPSTPHKQDMLDVFEGESVINGLNAAIPERELDRLIAAIRSRRTDNEGNV